MNQRGSITRRQTDSGVRYLARYRTHDGKERSKTFLRKTDAVDWLRHRLYDMREGITPDADQITVAEWSKKWRAGFYAKSARTTDHVDSIIKLIQGGRLGKMRIGDVRPSHVRTWVRELKDAGYADSYVYVAHQRFSEIMTAAVLDQIIRSSPCVKTSPPPGKPRVFAPSHSQVRAILNLAPANIRPAILLAAYAGLRINECVTLPVSALDFDSNTITVTGKGDKTVKLPVHESVMSELRDVVRAHGHALVVADRNGDAVHDWTIRDFMRRIRPEVDGLPANFRFHDLRHYYASALIRAGGDVKTVQTLMRHASATTTLNTYVHLFPDSDEVARRLLASAAAERRAATEGDAEDARPVLL